MLNNSDVSQVIKRENPVGDVFQISVCCWIPLLFRCINYFM